MVRRKNKINKKGVVSTPEDTSWLDGEETIEVDLEPSIPKPSKPELEVSKPKPELEVSKPKPELITILSLRPGKVQLTDGKWLECHKTLSVSKDQANWLVKTYGEELIKYVSR